jgi:glycosyltransferase involved in cell wall biosynthesis
LFSVIVPCYNEEDAIAPTVEELNDALGTKSDYELIVVNDGSTDRTPDILRELEKHYSTLRVIHLEQNQGYGAALKAGLQRAQSELIAITDADGTYPNDRLRELVEQARTVDMVVGARTGENIQYSKVRATAKIFLIHYASWIARQKIPDINSGMRVFRRDLAIRFLSILPNSFSFTITLAFLTSYRNVKYIPISYSPRIGKSKIRPIRDTLRFIQLIVRTAMYFAPLRVLAPVIALIGLGFLGSLAYDIVALENLTDKTLLLFLAFLNAGMFALFADMLDKRTRSL